MKTNGPRIMWILGIQSQIKQTKTSTIISMTWKSKNKNKKTQLTLWSSLSRDYLNEFESLLDRGEIIVEFYCAITWGGGHKRKCWMKVDIIDRLHFTKFKSTINSFVSEIKTCSLLLFFFITLIFQCKKCECNYLNVIIKDTNDRTRHVDFFNTTISSLLSWSHHFLNIKQFDWCIGRTRSNVLAIRCELGTTNNISMTCDEFQQIIWRLTPL